jgi:MoaA/NifB/PqqE/SkfB family radical SAM enzyme
MRKYIKIEIEAMCNLGCSYCTVDKDKFVPIEVPKTIHDLESLFSKFNPGKSCFKIEANGEILLYPELIQYFENKARNEGYLIEVLSNGIKALDTIQDDTSLRWIFSLDGHTKTMNQHRKLTPAQVVNVLEAALKFKADIQCVYSTQTVEEMNGFISYLKERNFFGFLHMFPIRVGKQLTVVLDYDHLVQADFIPGREYFRRWKFIHDYGRRDFVCDFFKNGYSFRITPNEIKMIKCDCFGGEFEFEPLYDSSKAYSPASCGTCFTHFEYNSERKILHEDV